MFGYAPNGLPNAWSLFWIKFRYLGDGSFLGSCMVRFKRYKSNGVRDIPKKSCILRPLYTLLLLFTLTRRVRIPGETKTGTTGGIDGRVSPTRSRRPLSSWERRRFRLGGLQTFPLNNHRGRLIREYFYQNNMRHTWVIDDSNVDW